jgi:transcriptional regulator with XRE-family HTH domain
MGIDPPALSRAETGNTLDPTLATLYKWAEALGQKSHDHATSRAAEKILGMAIQG